MAKTVDIVLKSTADTTGFKKANDNLKGLGAAAAKLGEVFGGANTYLGQTINNLFKGSIWEMGATAVGFLTKKIIEFWTASETAAKKAAEEERKAFDGRVKAVGEYQAAIEKCHSASVAAADDADNDYLRTLDDIVARLRCAADSKDAGRRNQYHQGGGGGGFCGKGDKDDKQKEQQR